jgi:deferrochelatase/peroxidase EfeB
VRTNNDLLKGIELVTNNGDPSKQNIQGLILRGYTHPFSCHLLFNCPNPSQGASPAEKNFFKALYPHVQSAEDWGAQKPNWMLNIGLTWSGMQALNVFEDPNSLNYFPSEFQAGPWSANSQSSLGDAGGPGDPSTWWYGNFPNEDFHCVVHAYALTQSDLDEVVAFVTNAAQTAGLKELFALKDNTRLTQAQLPKDEIHFGYRDGISEPELNWSGKLGIPDQSDLNNFLVGYPNGSIIQPGPASPIPGNPASIAAASFAKDGCYNAFRILYQDVAKFNTLLEKQAEKFAARLGLSQPEAQEWIAAKLMGRWRNGSPMMLSPEAPDPCTQEGENFGYIEQNDPSQFQDVKSASKCPFSAHTRVGNPRNEDLVAAEGTSGPPRILRRGMPYGAPLASTTDDGVDRGLIGLFLCGSFSRQFEQIYSWFNMNNFSSVFPDDDLYPQDAVMGNRNQNTNPVGTDFDIPMSDGQGDLTFSNLDIFIVTRGTSYCLLPGLASIRLIAGL